MQTRSTAIGLVVGVWPVLALAYFTFYPDLAEALFVGILLIHYGTMAAQVAFIVFGIRLFKRHRGLSTTVATTGIVGLVSFFTFGPQLGQDIRFGLLRPHYEARLATVLASQGVGGGGKVKDYVVDKGPPMRIAFYWQRGVLDNWVGLVHDPTRTLKTFDSRDEYLPTPLPLRSATGLAAHC